MTSTGIGHVIPLFKTLPWLLSSLQIICRFLPVVFKPLWSLVLASSPIFTSLLPGFSHMLLLSPFPSSLSPLSPLAGKDNVCWSYIQLCDYLINFYLLPNNHKLHEGKAMSILLTTCPQDQKKCLVHRRCSMFVELIND